MSGSGHAASAPQPPLVVRGLRFSWSEGVGGRVGAIRLLGIAEAAVNPPAPRRAAAALFEAHAPEVHWGERSEAVLNQKRV